MIAFGVMVLTVVVGTVAVLVARRVSHWVRVRAQARARWEPHTEEARLAEADGTPVALVTVQLVARSWGRRRVVSTREVGTCRVRYPGDPELLDLEALAVNRAETRNTSLRGDYR